MYFTFLEISNLYLYLYHTSKTWQHIKKGVPLRVEIGPRDVESDSCFVGRRDQPPKRKESIPRTEFVSTVAEQLGAMQRQLFNRALENRQQMTKEINSLEEFRDYFTPDPDDPTGIHGGFAECHFAEGEPMERVLKELKVSLRCVPLDAAQENGSCIFSNQHSRTRAVFAKAY